MNKLRSILLFAALLLASPLHADGIINGGSSTTTCCTTAAAKADEQAGSSNTLIVTPSQQQSHDSAAKASVVFSTGASPTIGFGYNVSSVTHVGTGDYTINFTTAFASTNYACVVTSEGGVSGTFGVIIGGTKATGSVQVEFVTTSSTLADPANGQVVCYGRQ